MIKAITAWIFYIMSSLHIQPHYPHFWIKCYDVGNNTCICYGGRE